MKNEKEIYIVISHTDTIVSRIIRGVTREFYNHASISVDPTLQTMYSFGRMHPYNPIWGGFVKESPQYGTFRRFQDTEILVMALPVPEETYYKMQAYLELMYQNRKKYTYNYAGLFLAMFHLAYQSRDHYYCSEFVRHILEEFQVIPKGILPDIVHPMDFMELPHWRTVYQGSLLGYGCALDSF